MNMHTRDPLLVSPLETRGDIEATEFRAHTNRGGFPPATPPNRIEADIPPAPKPSIGRIVIYTLPFSSIRHSGGRRAAIVTNVFPSGVNLHVFLDGENDRHDYEDHAYTVPYDPRGRPGTWHWPPRV